MIQSPYDTEARYSKKRSTQWTGYKVHLSETCEEDLPLLITNVETTPSTTPDVSMTETIHQHRGCTGIGGEQADVWDRDCRARAAGYLVASPHRGGIRCSLFRD